MSNELTSTVAHGEREAFEAFMRADTTGFSLEREGESYKEFEVATYWHFWQARAALAATSVAPTSGTWQPRVTAPVGEFVLVAQEFFGPGDWRIKIGELYPNGKWRVLGASWEPACWMPLPPVPGAAPLARTQAKLVAWASRETLAALELHRNVNQFPAGGTVLAMQAGNATEPLFTAPQAQPACALDSERLNWIERQAHVRIDRVREGHFKGPIRWDVEYGHNDDCAKSKKGMRAAIDNAMAADQECGAA